MADTTYNVRTVYSTNTAGAVSALDRLGSMFDRLGGLLGGLKSLLFGLPTLIAAAFATGAVAAFMQRVTQVGGAAEVARLSMAGMINAQMFATPTKAAGDFQSALFATDALIARMREHANALPGTFEDLQHVVQGSLSGGIRAGRSLGEIESQAADFMAVTQSLGIDAAQAGRDMQLMMSGRAGAQVASFSRLQSLIGKTAEEFNQLTPLARWQAIGHALGGFGPMIEAYKRSWDAVSSTASGHAQNLFRLGTAPFFSRVTASLGAMNNYFEHHEDRLNAIAELVGGKLADAWGRVERSVAALPGLLTRVGSSPGFARLWGLAERLQARAAGALSGPGPSRDAVGAGVGLAAGLGAGIPGLGLAVGALLAFATHTAEADSVLASLSTSGGSLLGALGTLWSVVTLVEGELGHLLAAALPGVGRGVALLVGGIDDALKIVAPALGDLLVAFRPVVGILGEIIGGVAGFLGSAFSTALQNAATQIAAFARATAGVVRSMGGWLAERGITMESARGAGDWVGRNVNAPLFAGIATAFERTNQELGAALTQVGNASAWAVSGGYLGDSHFGSRQVESMGAIYSRYRGNFMGLTAASAPQAPGASGPTAADPMARLNAWIAGFGTATTQSTANTEAQLAALNGRLTRGGTPTHTTNVTNHVQVHQTIEQADDPDRVLIATRDAVLDAMLHPVESHSVTVTR